MSNNRFAAQIALTFVLALSLSGCLMGSGSGSGSAWSEDGTVTGSQGAVSLAITSPTATAGMDTTDGSVSLGGTAGSDAGIAQVSWRNDRGGQGVANGTTSWQTAAIALELGDNRITVTAEDAAGETNSRIITVNRESGEFGSATLSWNAPTVRTDGSPLNNLAGYKIYYGRMSGVYDYTVEIDNPGVLTHVVEGLVSGEWYFSLAAFDADDIESDRSNEVSRTIS